MGFTVSCFWNMVLEFISCSGFRVSGWWFNLDLARDLKQLIPLFLLLLRLPLLPRPQLRNRGKISGACVARGVGVTFSWGRHGWRISRRCPGRSGGAEWVCCTLPLKLSFLLSAGGIMNVLPRSIAPASSEANARAGCACQASVRSPRLSSETSSQRWALFLI